MYIYTCVYIYIHIYIIIIYIQYWDDVELVDMSHRHEALRGAIFHLLIEVLATRCAPYPEGFVDWDSCDGEFGEDEFKMFRRRIEDSLLNCCVGIRAEALATLCRLLAASSQGSLSCA